MVQSRIVLGAMSGTSADGVDVAVTEISGRGLKMRAKLIDLVGRRFTPALRESILAVRSEGKVNLAGLARMGRDITLVYAAAARAAMKRVGLEQAKVACIAAHGQTLFHSPPLTIQWFDPSLLAVETGCTVVSDFRRADCALGGQGAPLVPFADYILLRDSKVSRVILNIGGIANITWLPAGGLLEDVIAFDTGPGNCISDDLMRRYFGLSHDAGGRVAARGTPDEALADAVLHQKYFHQKPPRSTDGPAMVALFQSAAGKRKRKVEDLVATACLITARSIGAALRHLLPGSADELIVAGGGTRNRALMRLLESESGLPVRLTEELGIPSQGREAMAFALLGAATLDSYPSNVPSVTGARRHAILGSITHP